MEKLKYESFEVEQPVHKIPETHSFAKTIIVLILIIVFQYLYLFFILTKLKEKNRKLVDINFKKFLLDEGNKKLDSEIKNAYSKDSEYDERIKKINKEMDDRDSLIKDIKKSASKLLKKLPPPENLEELKEKNNDKKKKINELKLVLNDSAKKFREKFNTQIIDSNDELIDIKNLIKNNIEKNNEINLDKCDGIYGNNLIFNESYYKCDLTSNNKTFLILIQTNFFNRYGVYFNNNEKKDTFAFDLNNKNEKDNLYENQRVKIGEEQKQNLTLLFDYIKYIKFDSKNKNIDYTKYEYMNELEIYNIY